MAKGPVPYPVDVRGVIYDSAAHVSEALGVTASNVYDLVNKGRADQIGIGRGRHGNHARAASKRFAIGGFEWPSMRAASLALGLSREYVAKAQRGVPGFHMETILKRAMDLRARQEQAALKKRQRGAKEGMGCGDEYL